MRAFRDYARSFAGGLALTALSFLPGCVTTSQQDISTNNVPTVSENVEMLPEIITHSIEEKVYTEIGQQIETSKEPATPIESCTKESKIGNTPILTLTPEDTVGFIGERFNYADFPDIQELLSLDSPFPERLFLKFSQIENYDDPNQVAHMFIDVYDSEEAAEKSESPLSSWQFEDMDRNGKVDYYQVRVFSHSKPVDSDCYNFIHVTRTLEKGFTFKDNDHDGFFENISGDVISEVVESVMPRGDAYAVQGGRILLNTRRTQTHAWASQEMTRPDDKSIKIVSFIRKETARNDQSYENSSYKSTTTLKKQDNTTRIFEEIENNTETQNELHDGRMGDVWRYSTKLRRFGKDANNDGRPEIEALDSAKISENSTDGSKSKSRSKLVFFNYQKNEAERYVSGIGISEWDQAGYWTFPRSVGLAVHAYFDVPVRIEEEPLSAVGLKPLYRPTLHDVRDLGIGKRGVTLLRFKK